MSATQTNLQSLMQKELSRKEFLGIVGLGLLSILGFGTILKILTGKSLEHHDVLSGYSASDYGGVRKKRHL